MFLIPWYVTLCLVQGVLVVIPAVGRESTTRRGALLGLVGPAAAMVVGVGVVALLGGAGASVLTWLGTVATPVLAGSLGWIARWRWPALTAAAAVVLYVVAWRGSGRIAEIAGMVLIGGACLAVAGIVGPITPARYLSLGLVGLVVIDTYLVVQTPLVLDTTVALHHSTLPPVGVAGGNAHPLPGLQQIELGNSLMGWLDFLAPALLGAVIGRRTAPRVVAGVVVAVSALLFGLLLIDVTDKLPATVPVLAGLAVTWRDWWNR
ncbi:MAG TPA: hypothetical protein VFQ71_03965 [Gaiellales bacterium]|nr:hypothetical protein [Gaiellales bacterium]